MLIIIKHTIDLETVDSQAEKEQKIQKETVRCMVQHGDTQEAKTETLIEVYEINQGGNTSTNNKKAIVHPL